jgi:hypothetical protein
LDAAVSRPSRASLSHLVSVSHPTSRHPFVWSLVRAPLPHAMPPSSSSSTRLLRSPPLGPSPSRPCPPRLSLRISARFSLHLFCLLVSGHPPPTDGTSNRRRCQPLLPSSLCLPMSAVIVASRHMHPSSRLPSLINRNWICLPDQSETCLFGQWLQG